MARSNLIMYIVKIRFLPSIQLGLMIRSLIHVHVPNKIANGSKFVVYEWKKKFNSYVKIVKKFH